MRSATKDLNGRGKLIALAVLGILCAWLVYRNLLFPEPQPMAASLQNADEQPRAAQTPRERSSPSDSAVNRDARRGGREQTLSEEELAALDPTLRLDLLEKSRQIRYEGSSRNIFQVYTPPPPQPVASPVVTGQPPPSQANPVAAVRIPLQFYGVAVRPGTNQKKAFLTDGEEIFIATEGELVAKRYKILRIGVNSIEVEDTQNHQRHQLPLLEE